MLPSNVINLQRDMAIICYVVSNFGYLIKWIWIIRKKAMGIRLKGPRCFLNADELLKSTPDAHRIGGTAINAINKSCIGYKKFI